MKLSSQNPTLERALLHKRARAYRRKNMKAYHRISHQLYELRNPGRKLATAKAWYLWNREWVKVRAGMSKQSKTEFYSPVKMEAPSKKSGGTP